MKQGVEREWSWGGCYDHTCSQTATDTDAHLTDAQKSQTCQKYFETVEIEQGKGFIFAKKHSLFSARRDKSFIPVWQ